MTTTIRALCLTALALGGCAGSQTVEPEPTPAGDQSNAAATADAAPAPAQADAAGAGPSSCQLAGNWQGTIPAGHFRGQAVTWAIAADGVTQSAFGPARVRSTTTLAGAELSIVDHEATPAIVACPADPPGRYAVAFSEACALATLTVVADPCEGRRDSLSGITLTRQ